jgi:molecular chaperone DnaK (HSP70)
MAIIGIDLGISNSVAAVRAGVLAAQVGTITTSLLARNTPIPVKKTELFATVAGMQTSVTVRAARWSTPNAWKTARSDHD